MSRSLLNLCAFFVPLAAVACGNSGSGSGGSGGGTTTILPTDPPNAPFFSSVGADGWTDAVANGFAAAGYTATHHQIGNVQVSVQGNTATMKVYVTATHVIDWSSKAFVATAVYTDHVVHTPQGWRFDHRSVRATSALTLVSASP